MISEHHYGVRSEMAALTLKEAEWLHERLKDNKPILIDFSPWPFPIYDRHGKMTGMVDALLSEIAHKTGLNLKAAPQTGIQTAEAKFMRGETDFWVPFPETAPEATYGATSVFSLPIPQTVANQYGAKEEYQELEMFARTDVAPELVSILRKAVNGIDSSYLQEVIMSAAAERKVVHRVFGMTREELTVAIIVVTRFLAMMSHELRTPLNAVIGFAEFMSREGLGEIKRKEYTDGILLSATALLELINDILDLSKLEAGAMNMRTGACDVGQLLRELPAIFGYRVRRHGVKLRIETKGDVPMPVVELSQQGMRQILINLVGNAAKFTEQGEIVVTMSWAADTHALTLEVTDTGCGISEEKMSKLFDPFVQDIASRMRNSCGGELKGTGLGLPIVKRMVDSAQGTITASSELGKGTTFRMEIPNLKVINNISSASRSAEETIRATLPERVLVVDDMAMNRKILGIHLANLKIKDIRYAENGETAMEVMRDWVPDLVLSDMWMPKMDGTQLAEAMRRTRELAEIPIVAVTADVDVGSTYDMSLFAKIIAKPVTADKLRALFGEIG